MFASRIVSNKVVQSVQRRCMSMDTNTGKVFKERAMYYSNPAVGAENPTFMKGKMGRPWFYFLTGFLILDFALVIQHAPDLILNRNKF